MEGGKSRHTTLLLNCTEVKNQLPTLFLLLAFHLVVSAQPGLNKSYDLNLSYNQFCTILVDSDTIVFVGISSAIDSPYIQSALIGRIDSLGNILGYNTIKDSLGGYLDTGERLVKTPSGDYAFTSAILLRKSDALYIFTKELALKNIFEFPDTVNLSVFYKGLVTLENGYLLAGYVTQPNHKRQGFVRKLDEQGNTVWHKYYGISDQDELVLGLTALSDTTFIICGTAGLDFFDLVTMRTKIWMIDSGGAVLKTWQSPDSLKTTGTFLTSVCPDGGLLGFAWNFNGYNDWGDEKEQPALIKWNSNLEWEWTQYFGPAHSSFSLWHDLRPTPDGNFIGAGRVAPYNLADLNAHLYGWLYKFTPEGDSIWARADLSEVPYESGIDDNVFGGVGFLSSGSVVAGGNSYINGQFYGWIIKVTPDGCIDTLYCQTSALRPESEVRKMKIYPNPADEEVFIDHTVLPEGTLLTLTALSDGCVVWQQTTIPGQQVRVATARFAQGMYVLSALTPRGVTAREKLVILHR